MLKHDEMRDPNSCLNKAEHDEPVFVLKSTDPDAPEAVLTWARSYHRRKWTPTRSWPEYHNQAKFEEALELADQMVAWRVAKGLS